MLHFSLYDIYYSIALAIYFFVMLQFKQKYEACGVGRYDVLMMRYK